MAVHGQRIPVEDGEVRPVPGRDAAQAIRCAEVRGRQWWYSLDPATFEDVQSWAEDLQRMWAEALQAFKHYVETEEKESQ